jgi:hypothetical protein
LACSWVRVSNTFHTTKNFIAYTSFTSSFPAQLFPAPSF